MFHNLGFGKTNVLKIKRGKLRAHDSSKQLWKQNPITLFQQLYLGLISETEILIAGLDYV